MTIQIARYTIIPAFMQMRGVTTRTAAAAIPWYLSGGIAAVNCLAAYTPKGATSLAASYDNNAAPGNGLADGTYDCTLGIAPGWDAVNGWIGNAANKYLKTGDLTPPLGAPTWSVLVRFAGTPANCLMGFRDQITPLMGALNFYPSTGGRRYYRHGAPDGVSFIGGVASGVMGVAGSTPYLNGAAEAGNTGGTIDQTWPLLILCFNNNGSPGAYTDASIQAIAVYDITLTGPQMAAVSAAMAAL